MDDPTRWSDPRGGAPLEIQRLLAAARGGPVVLPETVQRASAMAVAGLGSGAKAVGWWAAAKVVGALTVAGAVGVTVAHGPARSLPARVTAAPASRRSISPLERTARVTSSSAAAPALAEAAAPTVPASAVAATEPPASAHTLVAIERPRDHEAEAAMLERARRLLAAGDTALCVAVLRDHARHYPRSALGEERDYLAFRASVREAARVGVEREADRFLLRHPNGIYSSQVRAMRGARE